MQAKKETSDNFLRRTDALALALRLNVEELPSVLGVSRASLFGYRTGKRTITAKAWRKLEAAERAAGIVPPGLRQYDVEGMGARVQEEPVEYRVAGLPPDIRQTSGHLLSEADQAADRAGPEVAKWLEEIGAIRLAIERIEDRLGRIETAMGVDKTT